MEQENSTPGSKRTKILISLLIIVVAILALCGAWVWHNHIGSKTKAAAKNSNWETYKNTRYGFMFSYPKDWGTPGLLADSGEYQINFAPKVNNASKTGVTNPSLSVIFGSNKDDNKSSDIQKSLSGNKSEFIKYDNSSYAVLRTNTKQRVSNELTLYQIVNLSKINVSTVLVDATFTGTTQCSSSNLAQSSTDCATNTLYSDMSAFAKSFKDIK